MRILKEIFFIVRGTLACIPVFLFLYFSSQNLNSVVKKNQDLSEIDSSEACANEVTIVSKI